MGDYVVLEGMISIVTALECGNRTIEIIWIKDKKKHDSQAFSKLLKLAKKHNVTVEYMPYNEIEKHLHGKTSGGIIAFASERHFTTVDKMYLEGQPCRWVALEGFEDPYSYGNVVRTLYAAGFNGVLTPRSSWNKADTLLLKASAGAAEMMPTAIINDYDEIIAFAKQKGLKIICAEQSQSSVSLYDLQITPP
ncbi:MAG: RNA methyltransferase, partial [Defluviitaleaceae bacterium]|nr:RNA methyltransferase [Defluviitaleaceae bacterium]